MAIYEKFVIRGKKPLRGTIEVRGSKNAASKMMVASILTSEECTLENIPFSGEVDVTRELCQTLGSKIELEEDLPAQAGHRLKIRTAEINTSFVSEFSRKNRVPILTIGPLLHRKGFAEVPVPGGDQIGPRPINFHVEALAKMGVKIERREKSYFAKADKEIRGAEINLPYPSVGATENVVLTAVLARGKTKLSNAAVEPEIENLIQMLRAMGAKIYFHPKTREILITGVSKLSGVKARVMPDRNEVVSFACASLATGGDLFIPGIEKSYLEEFLNKVREIGGEVKIQKDGISFKGLPTQAGKSKYNPTFIETSPHPGFMTDWQQPFCVLLTLGKGKSIIHETVYEDRFGYTKDLKRMGANIEISGECSKDACRFQHQGYMHTAAVTGPTPLKGTEIEMTDIRAGMAHIIAALSAEGESIISGIEHIDRGYERIDERLRALGADIQRVATIQIPEVRKQELI